MLCSAVEQEVTKLAASDNLLGGGGRRRYRDLPRARTANNNGPRPRPADLREMSEVQAKPSVKIPASWESR
jgi:hypothetical protein